MSYEQLPKNARVIVIGGGVVGCSVLYHLAKKGWQNLLLLERRELSCGSSWHAAGQFHIINSNANLSALQLHTLKFYPQLQEESEQSIGLHRTGGIYFASTPERMNYLIQEQAKNRAQNPDMEFIDLDEAARMHPLIDKKHFLGALYDPLDGHIDPAGVVQAYAKAARKHGATIFQQAMVTAIRQNKSGDEEWEIECEYGGEKNIIRAEHVVNAGGLWAREVGRMVDLELPILAMEHHYLITEPLPEIESLGRELPAMVDFDGNAYGRQEGMGMLLGTYEENGTPWSVQQTPWDFGHELLPDDLSRIAPRLEVAFQHFPKLATAGIKKVVNGPFTFAPDGNALVGPVAGRRNLWSACGVMAGFCQGAGVGSVLADWMCEGEPGMDVFAMDIARFGDFADREYTKQKVIENFGRRFMVAYPNEELPAMRPLQTTQLYQKFADMGAVFAQSFGLEHVKWFSPDKRGETPTFLRSNAFDFVGEECRAVRDAVGCIEVANFAKHIIRGKDAEKLLRRTLAGRIPQVGRMALSPMLSERGKLLGDLSVANMGEDEFLLFGSGAAQLSHQRRFAMLAGLEGSDVQISNATADYVGLSIAGPNARTLLSKISDEDLSDFRFMDIRKMQVGGVACIVARVSFTGELGYEIYCRPDSLLKLHDAVVSASADDDLHLRHFGGYALMALRLEKNFGAWTLDYREDFTAAESGLDRFIDSSRDDYIGAAATKKQSKPTKQRVLMEVATDNADAVGDEPIYAKDGKQIIGFVTSGGYGHCINKSLAMGYVQADYAKDGTECAVEILGHQCPSVIHLTPPYDPNGEKMRG